MTKTGLARSSTPLLLCLAAVLACALTAQAQPRPVRQPSPDISCESEALLSPLPPHRPPTGEPTDPPTATGPTSPPTTTGPTSPPTATGPTSPPTTGSPTTGPDVLTPLEPMTTPPTEAPLSPVTPPTAPTGTPTPAPCPSTNAPTGTPTSSPSKDLAPTGSPRAADVLTWCLLLAALGLAALLVAFLRRRRGRNPRH
ncbi:hypothetical protein [Streptomyces sp. NPDC085932]|uniref:hypothetical protein n=1 Tax=Streptomyces sp. NPDC085932 TaxID=3365741 RepID=UPI0037CE4FA1